MTKKDYAVRAFKCRMDEEKEKPCFECLFCPYGKKKDPDNDRYQNMDCDVLKLYADIGSLLNASK